MPANSPQAKGRVERKHGVYQDRWVKELRLEGIRGIEAANQFLPGFADRLNAKFAVQPRSPADYHRPVPDGLDMRRVFCLEETPVVGNDWVVRYKNRFLQIVSQSNLPSAKNRVTVQEHWDGSIHLVFRDREVFFREIKELPWKQLVVSSEKAQTTEPRRKYLPPQDHPWRKFNLQSVSKRLPSMV